MDSSNSVRYYIKAIGYKAFDGKDVKSIEFNTRSQIEYIGDYAFANTPISSVSLPSTVKSIGEYAFYGANPAAQMFSVFGRGYLTRARGGWKPPFHGLRATNY
ncbi:MAG: leucine-rich repeat domain-containing protein [Muribaculaceae bacterium]|nr:leucine-rich repeat domain-containing protein [Muribaculaceae bacterium]